MKNSIFKMTSLHLQKMGSGMKLAAIVALCLTLTVPMLAQRASGSYAAHHSKQSTVTIDTWDNRAFIIEMDGKRYRADGSITVRGVNPGKKRVRIFRGNNGHNSHMNSRGKGHVIFNGFIDVPRKSRVRAEVTRNRSLRIKSVTQLNSGNRHNTRPSGSCGTARPSRPAVTRPSSGSCGTPYYGSTYEEELEYEDAHDFQPYGYEHTGAYGGVWAMEFDRFNRLIDDLECAPFSNDKSRIAKQALRHNHITVNQLVQIMSTFSFDSGRLAVAKEAWEKVIDKENSFEIYDAFTFSSSAHQFEDFIHECR